MSQENVDFVRSIYAASERGDFSSVEWAHPEIRIDMSRQVFNPATYQGHAGLHNMHRQAREVWDEFRIIPERFIDAGDHVVVMDFVSGRGRGSGVEVKTRSATVWTVREGRIILMAVYYDPQDALKAVGLAE